MHSIPMPRWVPTGHWVIADCLACWARRLLQRTDWFTQEKAACLLTAVLISRPDKGTAEVPQQPLMMNGSSSSHHAPPPVPTPTAESEKVQSTLVTFVDWLTSQLRCVAAQLPFAHAQGLLM